jgi:hypothetical protein
MDAQLKQHWINALRSGKYRQGKGFLQKNNKFCCLGVLCDIVDSSRWSYNKEDNIWEWGIPHLIISSVKLSLDILQEIQLASDIQNFLINLNDIGKSFEEIAQYIEDNI